MMTRPTFDDLNPPYELVCEWENSVPPSHHWQTEKVAVQAARWGAKQAAEQLAGQWPEPITDRPPTQADGDEEGIVQVMSSTYKGVWARTHWRTASNRPWRHTPRWQPPAPPTLKEQALKLLPEIEGEEVLHLCPLEVAKIRHALEAQP